MLPDVHEQVGEVQDQECRALGAVRTEQALGKDNLVKARNLQEHFDQGKLPDTWALWILRLGGMFQNSRTVNLFK